ncbi:MAG: phosphate ABC transporter permease subunit PstC [Rhodospirillales bacterium]
MSITLIVGVLFALTVFGFFFGRSRAVAVAGRDGDRLHSRPKYYGYYVALWCGLPALILVVLWLVLEPRILEMVLINSLTPEQQALPPAQLGLLVNDVRNLANGNVFGAPAPETVAAAERFASVRSLSHMALGVAVLAAAIAGLAFARQRIVPRLRARNQVESAVQGLLLICSVIAILTTIGIILSLIVESSRFFMRVPVTEFLFGTHWSPQMALRADQVGASGAFGAIPLFVGTLLISAIAMSVAMPVGLLSAIYMAEYAHPRVRSVAKPMLEILAGIPTVVYGFFAALTVAPLFRAAGQAVGLSISSESALAAGVVMGIMLVPFVSSLSDDVITAVPQSMRDGSLGLGATRSETIRKVILPAALPGIVGGFMLAISRAIGETMIVVMAAGLAANMTANPFQAVTTVTVQIATLLVGDQEFDSPKTLAAFALGLVLFCVTLILNVIALRIVQKYREQYD